MNRYSNYRIWAIERMARRMLAYAIVLPIVLALWPVTTIGDWLCRQYYIHKE